MKTNVAVKQEAPAVIPQPRKLSPERFKKGEFARNHWVMIFPDDMDWSEVLKTEYWKPAADKLRNGDRIEVTNDSLTVVGELIVVASNPALASVEVRELWVKKLDPVSQFRRDTDLYKIEYRGRTDLWAIVRKADNALMRKGLPSEDEAMSVLVSQFSEKVTPYLS